MEQKVLTNFHAIVTLGCEEGGSFEVSALDGCQRLTCLQGIEHRWFPDLVAPRGGKVGFEPLGRFQAHPGTPAYLWAHQGHPCILLHGVRGFTQPQLATFSVRSKIF